MQVSLTRLHSLCSMQRERSKRNTRGGISPTTPTHGTSAAGSGEACWHPFGEPFQTRPLTRSQTHGKVHFLCCGTKNSLTSHAKDECCAALAFRKLFKPQAVVSTSDLYGTIFGTQKVAAQSIKYDHKTLLTPCLCQRNCFRKAEAAYRFANCVAREGIFSPRLAR